MRSLVDVIQPSASLVSDLRNPALWVYDGFGVVRTVSGENVTPESAMALAAYYACIRVISEDVGKLPLHVFRQRGTVREKDGSHPLWRVLHDRPNPEMTSMAFRETVTAWALGWGNGYAEIVRSEDGRSVELWPIHPKRVVPMRDENGVLFYRVNMGSTADKRPETVDLPAESVLHIHGVGGDAISGWSIARLAAESLGVALAEQKHSGAFFGNGARPSGILKYPGIFDQVDESKKKQFREEWERNYGGASNAGKTAILDEGIEYQPISMNNKDSQFIESRQFSVEEICRWFRIPPHKVQHLLRSTFSNIESQNLEYVVDTLMPWLVRWEQAIALRLLSGARDAGVFVKHNVNALLRGDVVSRGQWYTQMLTNGVFSVNDVRELEDMNPVDSGDRHFVQGQMVPLDKAGEEPEQPEPTEPDDESERSVRPTPDESGRMRGIARAMLVRSVGRIAAKENKAAQRAFAKHRRNGVDVPGFEAWSDRFYGEIGEELTAEAGAVLSEFGVDGAEATARRAAAVMKCDSEAAFREGREPAQADTERIADDFMEAFDGD